MKKIEKAEHYEPPQEIVKVALERTEDIVREWRLGIWDNPFALKQLAVSLYLQGIEDASKVI